MSWRFIVLIGLLTSACEANLGVSKSNRKMAPTAQNHVPAADSDFSITSPTTTFYLRDPVVNITWSTLSDLHTFDLIVAADETCTQTVHAATALTGSTYAVPKMADGRYWICLSASNPDATGPVTAKNSPIWLEIDTVEPTVIIAHPVHDNGDTFTFNIQDKDVKKYVYKFGAAETTDCKDEAGYSETVAVAESRKLDLKGTADGLVVVCVLGIDQAGNRQKIAEASHYSWIKDTTAPALDAGNDVVTNSPVQLNATASDVLSKFSVLWSYSADDGVLTFSDEKSLEPTATATAQGIYTVTLTATDEAGNTSVDSMTLTWYNAPLATLSGAPGTVSSADFESINVNGFALTSYRFKAGPEATTDCQSPVDYSAAVAIPIPININAVSEPDGTFLVCVLGRAADGNWQAFTAPTQTQWIRDTTPPTVSVGPNLTTDIPIKINSSISDLSSVTYLWSQISGPGTVTFDANNIEDPTVQADTFGAYQLRLRVTDALGRATEAVLQLIWGQWCSGANLTDFVTDTGLGTQSDPFKICTVVQLQDVGSNLTAYYQLKADIDATATATWNGGDGFLPIGSSNLCDIGRFEGNFDGAGHSISNLTINRPTTDSVGLFGCTANSTVSDLVLVNASVTGKSGTGAVVGNAKDSTLQNLTVAGSVTGTVRVGGIAGTMTATSTAVQLRSSASVSGDQYIGGAFGECQGSVSQSGATGDVACTTEFSGGFVGVGTSCNISDSWAKGNVAIGSGGRAGGFAGGLESSSVTRLYATGNVNGSANDAGGLIGTLYNATITSSFATGNVTSLVAQAIGGLVGFAEDSQINNVWAGGYLTNTNSTYLEGVGGVFGIALNTTVNDSFAMSTISSNGESIAGFGGFLWAKGAGKTARIDRSFSVGKVFATSYDGGFLGYYQTESGANTAAVGDECLWDRTLSTQTTMCSGYVSGTGCNNANYILNNTSYWYSKMNTPMSLWDFTDVWKETVSNYPALQWQKTHKIFASSTVFDGNLGGVAGADTQCKALATAADLTGTWKAVLSSSAVGAADGLDITGPVYNMNGTLLSRHFGDFWDGTLAAGVIYDETGADLTSSGNLDVWTGTTASGQSPAAAVDACQNWTSKSPGLVAVKGSVLATDTTWVFNSTAGCDTQKRLYCVSEP